MKNRSSVKNIAEAVCFSIGIALLFAGILLFLHLNRQLISLSPLLTAAFIILLVSLASLALVCVIKDIKLPSGGKYTVITVLALIAAAVTFIVLILFAVGVQLFQPLALSTETVGVLIAGMLVLLCSSALGLIFRSRSAAQLLTPIFAVVMMLVGVIWAEAQPYQKFYNLKNDAFFIFENGESGYYTFRIPSLVALDKDVLNEKYGTKLECDMLLATAEARESSRDLGDIDIVGKYSLDNGKSWSELFLLFEVKGEKGKCGNPTPVFDRVNGVLNFIFMSATAASGYDYRTYNAQGTINSDLTFSFGEPILMNDRLSEDITLGAADGVNENTIMSGPGKGVQTASGRLIVPCSNRGESFAMLSDDYGKTWRRGNSAGTGNECEIAVLDNGELIMVARANDACNLAHPEQYLRFAYSADNGENWYLKASESTLKTPICMTSLTTDATGNLYCSYQNSFTARADLSLAASKDNGKTWTNKLLYDGASGYSCAETNSDGDLFVLAEIGKVNYNEALVFLSVEK